MDMVMLLRHFYFSVPESSGLHGDGGGALL